MGALPNWAPNGPLTSQEVRDHLEKICGYQINPNIGYKLTEVPHKIEEGDIKFLYVFGENPMMSAPWTEHFIEAVGHLDTMVVQDIFITETAQKADVVLPAASWGEKEGTFINTSRRIQMVSKAIEPSAGIEPD